jgi:hypothetical protein
LFSETRVTGIETPSFHPERLGYCFSASNSSVFPGNIGAEGKRAGGNGLPHSRPDVDVSIGSRQT